MNFSQGQMNCSIGNVVEHTFICLALLERNPDREKSFNWPLNGTLNEYPNLRVSKPFKCFNFSRARMICKLVIYWLNTLVYEADEDWNLKNFENLKVNWRGW